MRLTTKSILRQIESLGYEVAIDGENETKEMVTVTATDPETLERFIARESSGDDYKAACALARLVAERAPGWIAASNLSMGALGGENCVEGTDSVWNPVFATRSDANGALRRFAVMVCSLQRLVDTTPRGRPAVLRRLRQY